MAKKPKYGECYHWSGFLLLAPGGCMDFGEVTALWAELGADPASAVLVHGCPVSDDFGGRRIAHAWVECRDRDLVVDVQWGIVKPRHIGPLTRFYEVCKLTPEVCRYYLPEEARRLSCEHRHYGPWEPPPVEVVEMPRLRPPPRRKDRK